MKRISPDELEEMRSRGYDSGLLEEAAESIERGKVADELIAEIIEAFQGVTLGDGVGLWEGQGLDDYEDAATCAKYRQKDEKDDWLAIPSDDLFRCNSSLSFFDAKGMRFHLPAYLISALRGEDDDWAIFHLTHLDEHGRSKFIKLSPRQREVVRKYLLFMRDDVDCLFDRPNIDKALKTYWLAGEQPESEAKQDAQ